MSISGSLSNALSGLTAQSRAAEVVSSNVANATTEGYARRELMLTSNYLGAGAPAGVGVVGVRREIDMVTVQNRRLADASVGHDQTLSDFYKQLEQVLGTPDQAGSLSGSMDRLETALIEAASRPDNESRLSAVLSAAETIAEKLNSASDKVQGLRMSADQEIGQQVQRLNDGLERVQQLNYKIKEAVARGQDPSALMDIRQQTIDSVATIVPVRQVDRDHGTVALFTTGGSILLDGRAAEVEFSPVGVIVPEMEHPGVLSGLTINGNPIEVSGAHSPIKDGSLQALFDVRDALAPQAQSRLDAVARDLIERFQDPAVDATRASGDPGLFTDIGAEFDPADELGLSGRVAVNAVIDPRQGGALWRIRDGLGAATPGNVGDSTLIETLTDAFTSGRVPASGDFLGAARSASGLSADLLSLTYAEHTQIEGSLAYHSAEADALKTQQLADGVDTDAEMQKLMLIEQAYAANAKVIQTVGYLLDRIMEL